MFTPIVFTTKGGMVDECVKYHILTRIYNLNQTIVNFHSTNQLTLEHIHVTFDGKDK